MPPVVFCDSFPLAASKGVAVDSSCLICCEERPRYTAVGSCGHAEVCWICAVRLRAIVKDFRCPVCKEELNEVYLGNDPKKALQELNKGQLKGPKESKLGLVFASTSVKEDVERLFDYRCWHQRCVQTKECFPTIEALQKHLDVEHGRRFCPTCLQGRKVFLFEQLLYVPDDLQRHHDEGDRAHIVGPSLPQSPPHARCCFCKRSYYSEEDLIEHMNNKHQHCGICERQGRKSEFYRDYGHLSMHYEEEHYVCRHENCRREAYRLVAFASEDELWMHELKEHQAKLSQKAAKRGTRLALSMGASSYREVQQAQDPRRGDRPGSRSTATVEAVTGQVRFMRTRNKPPAPPESDWPKLQEESQSSASHIDEERYPPRAVKHQERRAAAPSAQPSQPSQPAQPSQPSQPRRVDPVREQHRALSQLLGVAVQRVEQTGINLVASLEQDEWRAKNRRFKRDLEEQLGPEELKHFKECSMQYRYQLRDTELGGTGAKVAASTYAQRVMEVFATTMAKSGEAVAAELLCDLVLLLPDEAPRHMLYQALDDLKLQETMAATPPAAPTPAPKVAAKATPKAQPKVAAKAPVLSRQLDEKLEALPISRSCQGGRLSFLSALQAVLEVLVNPSPPPVPAQALRRYVRQLDGQQAESLQLMHQHLVDAGGANLDFEPMDRLLSLRPLLQLKLGTTASSAAAAAFTADRERSWWEWKEAAAAAVQRMGAKECLAVQLYVTLSLKHQADSGAGYPSKAPPLQPAWKGRGPAPDRRESDFPALPSGPR